MIREPSIAESAKQRSLRVPLDHYEQPDPLVRTKWWLAVIAAGVAAVYFAWLMLAGPVARRDATPGPVSAAHAAWNDDCQACHRDLQPLRADSMSFAGLLGSRAESRESLDQACIKCHNEPAHHAAAKADEVPHCAACHREHEGAAADIVRPSDVTCLACHRDIQHHRNGPSGLSEAIANVTSFGPAPKNEPPPHPEFRSLRSDPGNIKFNHWLHMQPGIAVADAKRKLTLSDLDEAQRSNYSAYAKTGDLIQLDCAACHEPQAAGGAYMQPSAYERHCGACHPLQLNLGQDQTLADVPHGLSAERLTTVLDGLLLAAERSQHEAPPATPDESGAEPLIPGKTLGNNLAQKIHRDAFGRRATAARAIATKCLECHYARNAPAASTSDMPDVLSASVSPVWLRHARFDHRAHRHVECRHCHQAAFAFEQRDKPQFIAPSSGSLAARDDEQVMIAGLESCAVCHAAKQGTQGGVRHDCAECHHYHARDTHVGPRQTRASLPVHSFPGSSLGTHHPEVLASAPDASTHMTLARFASLAEEQLQYVGPSSCASAGCHGEARTDKPAWQTAFMTWTTRDPHVHAYDVLWTFRAREMTRLLGPSQSEGRDQQPLTDEQHFAMLRERCIGCHATPLPHDSSVTTDYSLGVHCQSCHGPAGQWLHTHYDTAFDRASAGFIDTKNLDQRAAACIACHVGSSEAVVDHDLIAAGHPRLAFEFHSYFESLPSHWDRPADEARQPGAFHFRSWLAGQTAQAEQRQRLHRDRPADFAQLDCFVCHHQLSSDSWRRPSPLGPLEPVRWPRTPLPASSEPDLLPPSARVSLARSLLREAADGGISWDAAVQSYLATRAIAGDIAPAAYPQAATEIAALNSALINLRDYLAKDCFSTQTRDNRRPTAYDSPGDFAPGPLAQHIQPVSDALQRLQAAIGTR